MRQALIVIDVQNDYFENGKMELEAPQEALQQIKRVLTFFKTAELPIIYIQHIKEGTTLISLDVAQRAHSCIRI